MKSGRHVSTFAVLGCVALAACGSGSGDSARVKVSLDTAPVRGPSDAWVTVVELGDFQCPYCASAAPTVAQMLETWPSDVRVAFKHFPLWFHARAMPAARAAECAREQGKFWEMYDSLYADSQHLEDADLEARAKAIGLDVESWKACLSSSQAQEVIDADVRQGGALPVSGTPAFFINGRIVVGARPFDDFRSVIEAELAAAKASGVPRSEYYDKVVLGR